MGKLDVLNQKYNRLTIIKYTRNNKYNRRIFLCKCDCGNETEVLLNSVRNGNTKSCGCLNKEKRLLPSNKKHGFRKNNNETYRIYRTWASMISRCKNTLNKNYGGRGISVCKEWNDFVEFKDWAFKNGYDDTLKIERINNNGNYEPNNCKWANDEEQGNNKRNNCFIECDGIRLTIAQWSRKTGLNKNTLRGRIFKHKWDIDKALKTKVCQ